MKPNEKALPSFSLREKIALVTGGSRGLGFEMAKALAGAGAHVLINGRRPGLVQQAIEAIASLGGSASALPFDVSEQAAVEKAFYDVQNRHGHLDILINNVGARARHKLFEFDLEALRRLLDVDLVAPFNVSRKAAELMLSRKAGRIINITSIAGPIARAGDAAYTSAKGGLEALTRALAAELGPHGITVNAIAPGFFATEANAALVRDEKVADWLAQRSSLGRWGEPAEIAGAALFLASEAASYVTGQVLAVDGGYLTHF